jgi:RNA polymerase sigma-70 factor, ECF subfamily
MNPQIYRGLNWGQHSSTFDVCIGILSRDDSRIPKQAMAGGSCGGTGRRSAGLCHLLSDSSRRVLKRAKDVDVMRDAYVRAFEHLAQFAGRAKFSTWLTRIAVHEALARQRRGNRNQELEPMSGRNGDPMDRLATLEPNPEQRASNSEIRRLLEEAVKKLPDAYRTIFMLRDVEELSTTETANILEITEENVKVRLHRARALLRRSLYARAGMERKEAFNFHAVRCDRVVRNVFERIQKQGPKTGTSTTKTQ